MPGGLMGGKVPPVEEPLGKAPRPRRNHIRLHSDPKPLTSIIHPSTHQVSACTTCHREWWQHSKKHEQIKQETCVMFSLDDQLQSQKELPKSLIARHWVKYPRRNCYCWKWVEMCSYRKIRLPVITDVLSWGDALLFMPWNQLIWSQQQQQSSWMQGRHHMLSPRRWEDEQAVQLAAD